MRRLVLLVVGVGQEHGGEPIESDLAVGLGIGDRRALRRWPQRGEIRLAMLEGAEDRGAQKRIRPHVETGERYPQICAKARPQRLGVANLEEVAADVRRAPSRLIGGKLVVGAAGLERL